MPKVMLSFENLVTMGHSLGAITVLFEQALFSYAKAVIAIDPASFPLKHGETQKSLMIMSEMFP